MSKLTGPDPFDRLLEDATTVADGLTRPAANDDEAEAVQILLDSVRKWTAREIDADAIDRDHLIPPDVRRGAAELGLYGLTVDEDHDGAGFSLMGAGRIIEEIATVDRSVAVSIGLHCGLGLRGLIAYGSDSLRDRYLPALAAGERIAAFAATEPEAGSHIAGLGTTGVWDGEDGLTVSGEKCYVTNGGFADVFTVLARTPGLGGARRGYSLLLLDRDLEGLTVGREEDKLGIRGSSTTTVTLEDVKVSTDQVIGEPGRGLDLMNEVLAWGRTLMSSGALGGARAAVEMATAHAITRRQFGKSIGAFGQIRRKIAEMHTQLYATESLVRLTGLLQARWGSNVVWESSAAKVLASESAWQIADESIQVHGGAGFIEEVGVARILRDCRITRIFEGANEVLRFHLASGALGFSPEPTGRLAGAVAESLVTSAERFDALHRAVLADIARHRKQHGIRIAERQLVLAGLADALIGLLALEATLLRADGELRAGLEGDRAAQRVRVAEHATLMLGTMIETGLARASSEVEEPLVRDISEFEYARVRDTL